MNKKYFISLITAFLFISCIPKDKKTNIKDIDEHVNAVERIIDRYDSNVQSAIDNKNFSYIKLVYKSALDSCSIKLDELKNIQVEPELDKLKESAVLYVTTLQEIITTEEAYLSLNDSTSLSSALSIDKKLGSVSEKAKKENEKYEAILKELTNQ